MGYGTILGPLLIIIGFEPLIVIPSILISQALASLSASVFHHKYKNVRVHRNVRDGKITFIIIIAGLVATIIAVIFAIRLPKVYLKIYIGFLVLIMGSILLAKSRFNFSWNRITVIGILSGFNKALSGGGFGPIVTSGQVISGNGLKKSVGITTTAEAPICICRFFTYIFLNGFTNFLLPLLLIIGALLATPFGPLKTKNLEESKARKMVGMLIIILGIFTLFKTFF